MANKIKKIQTGFSTMKKLTIETKNKTDVYPIVNSYNEWDPLEEIVVGVIEGASVPKWHIR